MTCINKRNQFVPWYVVNYHILRINPQLNSTSGSLWNTLQKQIISIENQYSSKHTISVANNLNMYEKNRFFIEKTAEVIIFVLDRIRTRHGLYIWFIHGTM